MRKSKKMNYWLLSLISDYQHIGSRILKNTFWNAALFGVKGYHGNPYMKHATMELDPEHFERWISIFKQTIDAYFQGPLAEEAKIRGAVMASMFLLKLDKIKQGTIKPLN